MYKIRLWATALLVVLCTGFYSCSGDEEDEKIPESITVEFFPDEVYAFLQQELLEKYSDVKCLYYKRYSSKSSNGVLLSGIKNKHLWFTCFDFPSKKQVFEWEDTEITDEVAKVYEGYGEYTDVHIERILPTYYKKTSSGYIIIIRIWDDYRGERLARNRAVFVSNNSSKSVFLSGVSYGEPIKDWYKESFIIFKSCYSHKGDLIYTTTKEDLIHTTTKRDSIYTTTIEQRYGIAGILISYEEGICVSNSSIIRYNYKEGKVMWNTYVTPPFEVPSNARKSISFHDQSTNIWKGTASYTFYDGTRKGHTFSINIDNGEIQ